MWTGPGDKHGVHPDPVRRERVVGHGQESEILGVSIRCSYRSLPRVTQDQHLRLSGRVGDERCHPALVDVGDTQLTALSGVLDPDDDPGTGREGIQVDHVLPVLPGG